VVDDDSLDIDLLASSLQADTGDVRVLLKALVTRLSGALGSRLKVERAGKFLRKSDEVRSVLITLGDDQLAAEVVDDRLECTVAHSSGGIRIRSVKVTMEDWLRQLLTALRQEAASSQATRAALEALVIGDGQ
jgi:hypothetical protein